MKKASKKSDVKQGGKPATQKNVVDYSDPQAVLVAFFTAMNAWERERWKRRNEPDMQAEQARGLAAMNQIFADHCTPKERKYGRLGSYSNPPEYDPKTEAILSVEVQGKKAFIETQQSTGFSHRCKYTLMLQDGRWLVDNKQWLDHEGKWCRCGL
jgi:hypothetical protein